MAHVVSLLVDALETVLTAGCKTAVDESDDSRAFLVRAGRLQADPTTNVVSILIHPNDPEDPDGWKHAIITENPTAMQNPWGEAAFRVPMGMYEIGGGEHWWRRFTIELQMFWMNKALTRSEALALSHLVLGRAEEAIKEGINTFGACQDEWGERPWGVFVKSSRCLERGGPDTDWIWNGRIWVQFGTEKP
jgi:hypothetical protein